MIKDGNKLIRRITNRYSIIVETLSRAGWRVTVRDVVVDKDCPFMQAVLKRGTRALQPSGPHFFELCTSFQQIEDATALAREYIVEMDVEEHSVFDVLAKVKPIDKSLGDDSRTA